MALKTTNSSKTPKAGEPLTYASYLKVPQLLELQSPLSDPLAHDEMLFIIIHQAYELWFKLMLFEMETLIQELGADNLGRAEALLNRISEIFKLLIHQVDILETMTPTDFNLFRSRLNPASGFQSVQFRMLEVLSGTEPEEYKSLEKLAPEWKRAMQAPSGGNLRQAFFQFLKRRKLLKKLEDEDERIAAISEVYASGNLELERLCERLIGYDEQFSLWRYRHVQMVERMIGMKKGTGGSLGVAYLQTTLSRRFFPEIWRSRTQL